MKVLVLCAFVVGPCDAGPPYAPPVKIEVPALVAIQPAGTTTIDVRLDDPPAAAAVVGTGWPSWLTADPAPFAAHAQSVSLVLHAGAGAPAGLYPIHLRLDGDAVVGNADLELGVGLTGGVPDASFGSRGVATIGLTDTASPVALVPTPDVVWVVGYSSHDNYFYDYPHAGEHAFDLVVARIVAEGGGRDEGFNRGRPADLGPAQRVYAASLDAAGRLLVAGARGDAAGTIWRVRADGTLDEGFGAHGLVDVPGTTAIDAVAADFAGIHALGHGPGGVVAARLAEDGSPAEPPAISPSLTGRLWGAHRQPDGGWLAGASPSTTGRPAGIVRVLPGGALDAAFGAGGFASLAGIDRVYEVVPTATGLLAATQDARYGYGQYAGSAVLVWTDAGGVLDPAVADSGALALPIIGYFEWVQSVHVFPDGSIVALTCDAYNFYDDDQVIVRLGPDGRLDPRFADGGRFSLRRFGAAVSPARALERTNDAMAVDDAGRVYTAFSLDLAKWGVLRIK